MKISEIKRTGTFAAAAIACIQSLPDDEVLTLQELSERIGRAIPTNGAGYAVLRDYRCQVNLGRTVFVYGNPKALQSLRKKLSI